MKRTVKRHGRLAAMTTRQRLESIYHKLYERFGPQHWWPAESPFEVMVGAILTQNTNWGNVEKAIACLKKEKVLDARAMRRVPEKQLARLIRSAGYYNIKAGRLQRFLDFFIGEFNASVTALARLPLAQARVRLLAVNGIGPETADSILLYALNKPVFVVDAYTRRMLLRHRLIRDDADYDSIQKLFMENLENKVQLFNEYHALIVRLAKEACVKNSPQCVTCPLKEKR